MKVLKKIVNKVKNIKKQLDEKRKKALEQEHCIDVNSLPESRKTKINLEEIITFGFVFRVGLAILFVVYLGYVAANSLDVIYAIITAFIISMAVESMISFFSKFIPRGVAIVLAYVLLFVFLTLGFVILIPFLISNLSQIVDIVLNKVNFWQAQLQTQSIQQFIQSLHLYPYLENKLLVYTENPDIANKLREILTTNVSNILQTLAQSLK
jgi:predicted PurR-regulated permease PerM